MNIAPLVAVAMPRGSAGSARLDRFRSLLTSKLGLHLLLDGPSMWIVAQATSPHVILPNGLLWGQLFDRHMNRPIKCAGDLRGEHDAASVVEACWGNYLAFDAGDGVSTVWRDPSGGVPCYHAAIDGAHIFATRPELLFDLGLMTAEIDWPVLAQGMIYRDWKPAQTPIRGVSELLPGVAARVSRDGVRLNTFWSPWEFVERENEISDLSQAVELVRRAGANCLSAWRGVFERPLVEVSGGLDSSLVAALMCDPSRRPACVTFAAIEGDPDETPYAHAVASHLGIELRVARPDVEQIDLTRSAARDVPRPCARGFTQGMDKQLQALAAEIGADAFFSGGGGDNVFCYLQSTLPLIDRIRRTGLNKGTAATISDLAELAQVSVWEVIAKAARGRFRDSGGLRWKQADLLSVSARRELPRPFGHPWTEVPRGALPGKRAHVRALMSVQNHLEGHERLQFAPIVSPLLSQPLVETCLRVPTWLWCDGGLNRAVARRAFASRLPASVIDRRSKGAFDGFCGQLVHRNRRLLREMLIDGALVRQGLVDPASVESSLRAGNSEAVSKLLVLADIEAWIGAWTTRTATMA